jgi:hypothetical protein
MACANAWLANIYAAGVPEPPPEADIPTEYVRKPRRRPAPNACLFTPLAPSICTSFARPKRRRAALSEIDSPNDKRQRVRNAPALTMSQTPQSPTRRSSRQTGTAGRTWATTKEASVVEQSWLVMPAPVLTPSVSEEHQYDAGGAEVESAYESTTSKRSRSPTRRMVDLQIARKPVVPKTATSSKDVPKNVETLYREVQALARRSKGVLPRGIEVPLRGMLYSLLADMSSARGDTGRQRRS